MVTNCKITLALSYLRSANSDFQNSWVKDRIKTAISCIEQIRNIYPQIFGQSYNIKLK